MRLFCIFNKHHVLTMSEWLIVGVALVAAILFLVYQANKEPEFKPIPPKEVLKMDLTTDQLKVYDLSLIHI